MEQAVVQGKLERVPEDIERIRVAATKMGQLLDELLELSRIGRLINPPQEVPLDELVQDALTLVAGRITEGGVEVIAAPDLPLVFGDRSRLVEVFQNLIDNAVKYMGDQPQPRVEIGVRQEAEGQIIFVRDNGMGIDPADHEKVFGLFDQLNPKNEGTGIGLALVKRIIEVHGGQIWVESAGRGEGSTFAFVLPEKPAA